MRAQAFDYAGAAATTGVISMNSTSSGDQTNVSVGIDETGKFIGAWSGNGPGDAAGIFTRTYDADGTALTGEVLLNSYTAGAQEHPTLAVWDTENYVVAYEGEGSSGNGLHFEQVGSVNQAPAGADSNIVVGFAGSRVITAADFGYVDHENDPFTQVIIDSIAMEGSLRLNGISVTAGQVIAKAQIDNGELEFVAGSDHGDSRFDFRVHDGARYDLVPNTLTFEVQPKVTFVISTHDRFDSGPASLTSWENGDLIEVGGSNLQTGNDSQATFSIAFSIEADLGGSRIDGLHVVANTIEIGTATSITLNPGDVLFSVDSSVVLPGIPGGVEENDIVIFRPNSATDYSSGTYELLIDMSSPSMGGTSINDFWSLTLVEKETVIGGQTIAAGEILFSQQGGAEDNDIYRLQITRAGEGNSNAVESKLFEGDDLGITEKIHAIELLENETSIGGTNWDAGTLLISLEKEETGIGDSSLAVTAQDIFALQLDSPTSATATMFFDGSDAGIAQDNKTNIDSLAILGVANASPTLTNLVVNVDENAADGTGVGTLTGSDPDGDSLTYSLVGGTGASLFDVDAAGNITVVDGSQLDFETATSFTLDVVATDTGGLTDTATVTIQLNNLVEASISGSIFEDTDGDANYLEESTTVDNVLVRLYRDSDSDGLLTATDQLVRTTLTTGGSYQFEGLGDDQYFVVVDSKTIVSSQTLNAGFINGDSWAEQTYGSAGSLQTIAGVDSFTSSGGEFFGGRTADGSDDTSNVATAEHVTRVQVAGADISSVDYAFSFNVVTNTLAGDARDDDLSFNSTVQGSLRQFIQNANALAGDNSMRFVPVVAANTSQGGESWWRIAVTYALPSLTDAGTTLSGMAFASDGSLIDSNAGNLGTGGTVGATGQSLSFYERPELEIVNDRSATAVGVGLDVQADRITIQHFGVSGFGDGNATDANIRVGSTSNTVSDTTIEKNIIGSAIHAVVDPALLGGAVVENRSSNVLVQNASNGVIQNNLIAFADRQGIQFEQSSGWQVLSNEIRNNGQAGHGDGVGIQDQSASIRVERNLIACNTASGIDLQDSLGSNLITANTIRDNGSGATETSGIRVYGDGNTIEHNSITHNTGAGVLVKADHVSATGAATQNRISENQFESNGSVSIDLVQGTASGSENQVGDGWTPNDASTSTSDGNLGLDHPQIALAETEGGNTIIRGTGPADSTIEIYRAVANGSGTEYLGSTTSDAAGDFNLVLSTLSGGDAILAVAIDANQNTSEMGAMAVVNTPPTAAGQTLTVPLNGTLTISVAHLGFGDADGDPLDHIVIESLPVRGVLSRGGIPVVVGEQIPLGDLSAGLLSFAPDADESGVPYASFGYRTSDGTSLSDVSTVRFHVPLEAPVFSSPSEYKVEENNRFVGRVNANDPEQGDLIYSIVGGEDDHLFQIGELTGALRFVSPPDFELPLDIGFDNSYEVVVRAEDVDGLVAFQTIIVNITNVDEEVRTLSRTAVIPPTTLDRNENDDSSESETETESENDADSNADSLTSIVDSSERESEESESVESQGSASAIVGVFSANGPGAEDQTNTDARRATEILAETTRVMLGQSAYSGGSGVDLAQLMVESTDRGFVVSPLTYVDPEAFSSMFAGIDQAREELDELPAIDLETTAIAAGVSGLLTVGYAVWLVQSGALVTGLVSSLPSWQLIDPLPILEQTGDEEDDGIDEMVEQELHSDDPNVDTVRTSRTTGDDLRSV